MKFFYFYEDLLTEARYFSDEKFNWVASNIGTWILDSTIENPSLIRNLPLLNQFKEWLQSNTNKPTQSNDDIILATDHLEPFLNQISPRDSQRFMKEAMERFPLVKSKITAYLKPEKNLGIDTNVETGRRRGRPPGTKNKPKIDLSDPSIKIIKRVKPEEPKVAPTQSEPKKQMMFVADPSILKNKDWSKPEITEPTAPSEPSTKRMGRPKLYSDDLTAFERAKYKKEGPGMIKSLEGKVESLNYEAEQIRQRILKIMGDIDKRKKFFGIE